jgi:hypothetical protein
MYSIKQIDLMAHEEAQKTTVHTPHGIPNHCHDGNLSRVSWQRMQYILEKLSRRQGSQRCLFANHQR